MNLRRVFILCLLALCTISLRAQISDAILEIFHGKSDSVIVADSAHYVAEATNQDSLQVAQLQQMEESPHWHINSMLLFCH